MEGSATPTLEDDGSIAGLNELLKVSPAVGAAKIYDVVASEDGYTFTLQFDNGSKFSGEISTIYGSTALNLKLDTDVQSLLCLDSPTYVLYDYSNPRLCGDDDDYMATLNGGSISKSRCGRVSGPRSPKEKSVACDLTERITNELHRDDTTIGFDGEGTLSIPKNLSHLFKKSAVVPAAIEQVVVPQ